MTSGGSFGGGGACIDCGVPTQGHKRCRGCYLAAFPETPLRAYRAESGKSFAEISRETGISRNGIEHYGRGYGIGGGWGRRAIQMHDMMCEEEDPAARYEHLRLILTGVRDPKPQAEDPESPQTSLFEDT